MGPSGFVAVICGWITTEVGRQPWVIYGLLRTREAVSRSRRPA
jgi:cytochrome d ubiquinol oxidase subunit I